MNSPAMKEMSAELSVKDQRIQDTFEMVLGHEDASNLDGLNAAMILMTKCLRHYPLGMREAHTDAAFNAIVKAAFQECTFEEGPEIKQ